MLECQANVCSYVNGKSENVDWAAADLVTEIAEEERGESLHNLVDGNSEVDLTERAVIGFRDGSDRGEIDECG